VPSGLLWFGDVEYIDGLFYNAFAAVLAADGDVSIVEIPTDGEALTFIVGPGEGIVFRTVLDFPPALAADFDGTLGGSVGPVGGEFDVDSWFGFALSCHRRL